MTNLKLKLKYYFFALLFLVFNLNLSATELVSGIETVGPCWVTQEGDGIKIVSFNDHWSLNTAYDDLSHQVLKLLGRSNLTHLGIDVNGGGKMSLGLHCGGYGASIVALVDTSMGEICLWAHPKGGDFDVRSIGQGDHANLSNACDGNKWGELIIGLKANDEKIIGELKSKKWSAMIKNIELISMGTYKIELQANYLFRETEIRENLLTEFGNLGLKYVDLNRIYHPVGEYLPFK